MIILPSDHKIGRRLLPVVIDEISDFDHRRIFATIPISDSLDDGFVDVTYRDFANAINRMASLIETEFGGKSSSFETLSYTGPSDIGYFIIVLAACKMGFKTLLASPLNKLDEQLGLLKATGCKAMLFAEDYPILPGRIEDYGIPIVRVPTVMDMLNYDGPEPKKYKFAKTYDEAKMDPFVVVTTSGSTGAPKPVVLPHGWLAAVDNASSAPVSDGHASTFALFTNKKMWSILRPFHGGGLVTNLIGAAFWKTQCIWPPSRQPITADLVKEMIHCIYLDIIVLPPYILEELTTTAESCAILEKVDYIAYGGAPLSRKAGSRICMKTNVINILGTTEICIPPTYQKDPEDWEYLHYSPDLPGIQMRPMDDCPGLYQQVIVRDPATNPYHSAFWTFPEAQEYHVNDTYTKHPSKPNLWLYAGRSDDVIVLSNGKKFNPTSMEAILRQHHDVEAALIVGQGKFAPAVAIQLKPQGRCDSDHYRSILMEEIWLYVEAANEIAPAHAQIAENMVFLADYTKPFRFGSKRTVLRQKTITIYAKEIENCYSVVDEEALIADLPQLDVNSIEVGELENGLQSMVKKLVGKRSEVSKDANLFNAGVLDSLQVVRLAKQLKSLLIGVKADDITSGLVYANPSIAMLAAMLKQLEVDGTYSRSQSRKQLMDETLQRYIKQLPSDSCPVSYTLPLYQALEPPEPDEGLTVLLTGSTGSLGSYLLHELLNSPNIHRVYCINRTQNMDLQMEISEERGLISDYEDYEVHFLHGDLNKRNLGVCDWDFYLLLHKVDIIIHCQWPVDFQLAFPSFIPHITGTLNLIRLSWASPKRPPIFFTSSLGTVANWASKHANEPVPETSLSDPELSFPHGYSESKWVTERLLDAAGTISGVKSVIWRIGQIAGPVCTECGAWNINEWFPSLIISSYEVLNAIPIIPGAGDTVRWIPVDILAQILIEIVQKNSCDPKQDEEKGSMTEYYNLINPESFKWNSELVHVLREYFFACIRPYGYSRKKKGLELVTLEEWAKRLENSTQDDEQNPAYKLIDFFRAIKVLGKFSVEVKKAQEDSETMKTLEPVSQDWIRLWLRQWAF